MHGAERRAQTTGAGALTGELELLSSVFPVIEVAAAAVGLPPRGCQDGVAPYRAPCARGGSGHGPPGLVVLSLSAWGRTGPWAGRRGFDSLVQAAPGIAHCEAAGSEAPGVLPAQLLDHATGYL